MLLLYLLMSPGGTVSDVLSRKSLSCCVLSWLCSYYWFWPARLSGSASQILDVTHGVHLLFKSSGFESPQQLEPACSKGDAWGCWLLLVTLAWLLEEVLQGCWSHATSRHSSSAPPSFYPLWVSCCLVPTPLPSSYRSRFMTSVRSPPSFSGFPATTVIACTEMQVIRLTPVSCAWWAGLENWSDKVHASSIHIFCKGYSILCWKCFSWDYIQAFSDWMIWNMVLSFTLWKQIYTVVQ